MRSSQPGPDPINAHRLGWILLQRIVGRRDVFSQPRLNCAITCQECAKAVSDQFTFGGLFTYSNLGADGLCHLVRQRDAELLG